MKKWFSCMGIVLVGLLSLGVASCGKRVKSLCILDPDAGVCWVNEAKRIGFTFEQINKMIDGNNPVYCVDTHDLRRVQRRLSRCQAGE